MPSRFSCCESPPPALSVGARAVAAIVPLREGIGFFFFRLFPPWFLFPFRQVDFFLAHRWGDLIRTFLSDLFTMGRWLYL